MDKSIVFDTCMQIRHNYDGCKKGMRPSGGRCVPAKGRMAQGNHTGAKIAAGVLGAGALGTAIALPFALGGRKGKGAAVSESPVEQKPVKAEEISRKGKTKNIEIASPSEVGKAKDILGLKKSDLPNLPAKRSSSKNKESGAKATGRATPLTGRTLTEEEMELSTANTPKSKKHRSSTFSGKKMARPTRKNSAAQLVFDALSFVLSDRY